MYIKSIALSLTLLSSHVMAGSSALTIINQTDSDIIVKPEGRCVFFTSKNGTKRWACPLNLVAGEKRSVYMECENETRLSARIDNNMDGLKSKYKNKTVDTTQFKPDCGSSFTWKIKSKLKFTNNYY